MLEKQNKNKGIYKDGIMEVRLENKNETVQFLIV